MKMLNIIWPIFIIISIIYAIFTGKTQIINKSIFDSARKCSRAINNTIINNEFMVWNYENSAKYIINK